MAVIDSGRRSWGLCSAHPTQHGRSSMSKRRHPFHRRGLRMCHGEQERRRRGSRDTGVPRGGVPISLTPLVRSAAGGIAPVPIVVSRPAYRAKTAGPCTRGGCRGVRCMPAWRWCRSVSAACSACGTGCCLRPGARWRGCVKHSHTQCPGDEMGTSPHGLRRSSHTCIHASASCARACRSHIGPCMAHQYRMLHAACCSCAPPLYTAHNAA